jgi:acetate kinase
VRQSKYKPDALSATSCFVSGSIPRFKSGRGDTPMPQVLCFNPGSNSLKFDVIAMPEAAARAGDGKRMLSGMIENIGKETKLEIYRDEQKVTSKQVLAKDFSSAAGAALEALSGSDSPPGGDLSQVEMAAVRVVHGGSSFTEAVPYDQEVRKRIEEKAQLAPLHNANSLRVIDVLQEKYRSMPIIVAFDTAFHHTLPERAWRYPLPIDLADRYGIRKYGFHGLSHRYQMEQYAHLAGKRVHDLSIVTTHLESGSSITAIQHGQSVDTSMGFTPLEGLMMGTRSGSIDPAILPFLMDKESLHADAALEILEKKSGLLGVSQVSLDTRVLRKRGDARSRLALELFAYRLRQMAGAYLAVLGKAQAFIFGGGIGENMPEIRSMVCEGLAGWGIVLDADLNERTMNGDVKISRPESAIEVWAIHSDEALQLAFESVKAHIG